MTRLMSISLLALALNASTALAQDTGRDTGGSAKAMLPQCMAALKPETQSPTGGRCLGILTTLSFVSRVLPDNLTFCQPDGATPDQILQVISGFLDANPDAVGQDFRLVALAAMRSKWPCEN